MINEDDYILKNNSTKVLHGNDFKATSANCFAIFYPYNEEPKFSEFEKVVSHSIS